MGEEGIQEEIKTLESLIDDAKAQCEQFVEAMAIVRMDEHNMAIEAAFPNGMDLFYPLVITENDPQLTEYLLYCSLLSHVTFAQVWAESAAGKVATCGGGSKTIH